MEGPSELLGRLSAEPELAAILLDVDGTLAPIVARPEDAAVPEATRRQLGAACTSRYALVACVSGRPGADARRIVGRRRPRSTSASTASSWSRRPRSGWSDWTPFVASGRLARRAQAPLDRVVPLPRASPSGRGAACGADRRGSVARRAEAEGLRPRWGRMVLEVQAAAGRGQGHGDRAPRRRARSAARAVRRRRHPRISTAFPGHSTGWRSAFAWPCTRRRGRPRWRPLRGISE